MLGPDETHRGSTPSRGKTASVPAPLSRQVGVSARRWRRPLRPSAADRTGANGSERRTVVHATSREPKARPAVATRESSAESQPPMTYRALPDNWPSSCTPWRAVGSTEVAEGAGRHSTDARNRPSRARGNTAGADRPSGRRNSPKSVTVSKLRRTRFESRSDTRRFLAIRRSKTLALGAFRVANKALAVLPKAV